MREIKFRAWDKELKRISLPFRIGEPIIQWEDNDVDMPIVFAHVKDARFEFLQFTGLLDREGVEIYEGDVVQVPFGYSGDHHYKETTAIVEYDAPEFWLHDPQEEHGIVWQDVSWGELSIIGNIYENSELVEVKK